jgi:phospholipase C
VAAAFIGGRARHRTNPTRGFHHQENHTYDNYFGQFPGGNGVTTGVSRGKKLPLTHAADSTPDLCHLRKCAWQAYDYGAMDDFALGGGHGLPSYQQYDQSDIAGYWQLASEYVLADNFFSSVLGPSFPNHLMTVGAFADAADNPDGQPLPKSSDDGWGCDTSGEQVAVVQWGFLQFVAPCFNVQTLPDELDAAGISWKYYAPQDGDLGYIWSALDAISHIRYGADWKKVVPYQQFAIDAAAGNLPAVSWLIAPYEYSEHPPESVSAGMNWTLQELQAVTSSPN